MLMTKSIDGAQMDKFFDHLYGGSPSQSVCSIFAKRLDDNAFRFFTLDNLLSMKELCQELSNEGYDVYARVSVLSDVPSLGRGTEQDTLGAHCLWIDLDIPLGASQEEALETMLCADIPPSMAVSSGLGLHCYWRLDHFSADLEWIKGCCRSLQQIHQADVCSDLARVLRVPGTFSYKYSTPGTRHFNRSQPIDVTILHIVDTVYSKDMFTPIEEPESNLIGYDIVPMPIPDNLKEILEPKIHEMFHNRVVLTSGKVSHDRSSRDFKATLALLQDDIDPGICLSILQHPTWDIGAKYRSLSPARGEDYTQRTLNKAMQCYYQSKEAKYSISIPDQHGPLPDLSQHSHICTDDANATRLCHWFSKDLILKDDTWYSWNGQFWADGTKTHCDKGYAKLTARRIMDEAENTPDPKTKKALTSWARQSSNSPKIMSMINLAKSDLITTEPMDSFPRHLACANGVVDLQTGELGAFDRKYRNTSISEINYDPTQLCPMFMHFLDEVFEHNQQLIDYIQIIMGQAISGESEHQCLNIFYGTGANGKSTLTKVMTDIVGRNYTCNLSPIIVKNNETVEQSRELAKLENKRLCLIDELSDNVKLDVSVIKRLVGGDDITGRAIYQNALTFIPSHTVILPVNTMPSISSSTDAAWRRISPIPFNVSFLGREDWKLGDKLKTEYQGILAWAVQGAVKWFQDLSSATPQITPPVICKEMITDYKDSSNSRSKFLADRTLPDPTGRITSSDLYEAYTRWCDAEDEEKMKKNVFLRSMPGYIKDKTYKNTRCKTGLRLIDQPDEKVVDPTSTNGYIINIPPMCPNNSEE